MKALFPGSFDPLTKGHLNIIKRATAMFDEVIVGVMTNTTKTPLFSLEERKRLIQETVKGYTNVSVIGVQKGLTVDLARQVNADVILRGIRDIQDCEFEKQIAIINRQLDNQIETLLMVAAPQYSAVSSTIIKEISRFGGDISQFVPPLIANAIREKINEKN